MCYFWHPLIRCSVDITEAGKGSITKRDLQRVATEHDFSWSDEEMAAMIHCFDSDGDGKVGISFCAY